MPYNENKKLIEFHSNVAILLVPIAFPMGRMHNWKALLLLACLPFRAHPLLSLDDLIATYSIWGL